MKSGGISEILITKLWGKVELVISYVSMVLSIGERVILMRSKSI